MPQCSNPISTATTKFFAEISLVELEFTARSDVLSPHIKCRIETVALMSALAFEILSYAWDNPSNCIEVHTKTILVTVNLLTSLTYLRSSTITRLVGPRFMVVRMEPR